MNIAAADKGRERDREVFKRPSELREVVKLIADDRDYGVVILKVRPHAVELQMVDRPLIIDDVCRRDRGEPKFLGELQPVPRRGVGV